MTDPFHVYPYRNQVFRNIYTAAPSQNLLDDICDDMESDLVDAWIQNSSLIDHNQPGWHRPFQYNQIQDPDLFKMFQDNQFNQGRFGDGCRYGVWYSAEDDITSVKESCWTQYLFARDNQKSHEVITCDRSLFSAIVQTEQSWDLTTHDDLLPSLVSSDYGFCQGLGHSAHQNQIDVIRTPSARHKNGVCTPVFSPNAITDTNWVAYFKIHINPDQTINVGSSRDKINFTLAVSDLESPHAV